MISRQIRVFRLLGMLPGKNSNCLYSLWGSIVFFLAGIGLITCQAISILYVQSTNDLVKELLLFCTTSTIAIKIVLFYSHRQHLFKILDIMKTADKQIDNLEDVNAMKNVHAYCRLVMIAFLFCYLGSLPPLFLEHVFLDKTECTWKSTALVPYGFAQQPIVYHSILVAEAIGNSLNCIIACTLDSFGFLLISLLCGHIEVLSLHLKKIGHFEGRSKNHSSQLLKHMNHYNLLDEYVFHLKL